VAAQTRIKEDFLKINQDWLLKPRPEATMTPESPHLFTLRTPAEKYQVLTGAASGVGALAVVQWVVGTSDGGEPEYSKPVVLVLGPLIAPSQQGNNVGYDLGELGLSYHQPVQPLGKVWSSKRMYPLLSPMFRDTRLRDADSLIRLWTGDWNSVYQFDHGLRACGSVAAMDNPKDTESSDLAQHPLWMPASTTSTITVVPENNAARIALAAGGPPNAPGAWALSNLLLIPAGGNLPIGFGVALDDNFSRDLFFDQLADQHGTALAHHVDSWLQGPWCTSWFKAVKHSPVTFILPILSWSQMRSTLDVVLKPEQSSADLPFAFRPSCGKVSTGTTSIG